LAADAPEAAAVEAAEAAAGPSPPGKNTPPFCGPPADMLREKGLKVDEVKFDELMSEQKARAKAAWKGSGDKSSKGDFKELLEEFGENKFSGYDELADTLKNKHFDLIFIDMSLCKDDITHFANKFKKLKHTTQNAQTKTIGIVSNTSDVSMRQVMENFDECVKKPIDTRALTTLLDKFIPNFKNFVIRECVLIKNEDIILCKKSDIENKIFGAALGEFGKNLSIAKGFGELISKMNEKPFGLILVDESVADFDMDALLGIVETFRERFSVDARMLVFSDKSYQSHAKSYIKALSPHISKIELANVIKNELNDIGKAQL